MEIMTENCEPYENKKMNALNDKRIHGGRVFNVNADTHILFEYVPEISKWVIVPQKIFAHSKVYVDNMHLLIQIHPPEGMDPQPILRDISDPEFMRLVVNALDSMSKMGPPACLKNLKRALKAAQPTKHINKRKQM